MVLIEGRRRDPQAPAPGQKRPAEDASLQANKQPRSGEAPGETVAPTALGPGGLPGQAWQTVQSIPALVTAAPPPPIAPNPQAAAILATLQNAATAPAQNPQTAALVAALAAQNPANSAQAPPPNPQALAILSALGGAGAAAGTAAGGTAPAPSSLSPQAQAVIAALVAAKSSAPPTLPASSPLLGLAQATTPGATAAPATASGQIDNSAQAPPPNPQALAILSALGGAGAAAGTAAGGAAPAPSSLSPQAQAVIAALVAAKSSAPATLPASSPLLGLAPTTTPGATAAPANASGQIDIIAHLAASARINAAMNAAYSPPEEQQPAPVAPEPAAFDKDALRRLAQRAAEGPIEDEPPPPPPPESAAKVAIPEVEQGQDVEEPAAAPDAASDATNAMVQPAPIQEDDANGAAPATSAEAEAKKKDSSSIATMLSYAQSNVAKGKVPADKSVDTASLQQAFTIGGGASGHASTGLKGLSPVESLSQRLDSAGPDLPSEERKDLQQQISAVLPKLEPSKAAELIGKLQGAEGIRSSYFLDEIARCLHPSRFTSSHLTRILASLSSWAAAVSGSDADGKIKLSEDARSFFTTSAAELSLRLMDVAPKDLSQIATAMATIGMTEERFFASLARASVARCERFSVEEILVVCAAFDKAGMVHLPLLEASGKLLRMQVAQVPGPELSKGLRSLATCCVRDLALGRAVGEHLAEGPKGGLTPEEFCSLAWTFVTLGFYHDQMFRAVFKALEDAPTMPGDTLCQLYEIHLALKAFRNDLYGKYELEESAVQSLKAHYRKQRGGKVRDVKLDRSMEKVCKDIADCLQKVVTGSVSRQHQTELGMAVDIAVSSKRGSRPIAFIEVDGSHSLMKTLDLTGPTASQISRVRGPVLLKRYLLQKHGFRIAVVPEDFWRSLPDTRDKRDSLQCCQRIVEHSNAVPGVLPSMLRFLRIMDMLQLGLREGHLQVLMEAYCDASDREFSYLDFCNSVRRRASEVGSTSRKLYNVSEPSRYFTRKGKVIPLVRQAPLSARSPGVHRFCSCSIYDILEKYAGHSSGSTDLEPVLRQRVVANASQAPGAAAVLFVYHIFFVNLLASFYQCVMTDPGVVPPNWGFYMGDETKRRRYCKMCNVWKPDRTHHCSICNRCILNMDRCLGMGKVGLFGKQSSEAVPVLRIGSKPASLKTVPTCLNLGFTLSLDACQEQGSDC
ncbi:PAT14 [Symbiodinium natans]|uniref:PAT14 protein n=1 Tax=Symbiodinium natans TaxID=878477 RepID=A0A812J6E0_9DINO|nr:PAT14 [Symbiodinium natans]